ncbi:hypothetical protein HBH70_224850 [Parastagonospora nodorum]|nr:hypothetical protein HBH53_232360 [Parastagonospora nodorum]KAH3957487.1 hypothetical protein HBH51_224310 [Parastagonospora nodorum]KAH3964401.1 hypothetical protein HBH52_211660 [Parastagonospora nodorum]KAH4043950.1 hypothetical protein HBH49_223380 [Parastagonospora nodorum]KAH4061415.1 hypothetical protein HBH50_220570 [Parastagonospora nodorum]
MAPTQTQTLTSHHEQFSKPITLTGRISKPATRTTTRTPTNPNKSLLSYTPQIPPPHPDIPISLLRNKLLLQCRPYIPSRLLHEALADGLYARATHWITPASLTASRHGKHKRYFVLHTSDFSLQQVGSAWEARVCANSRGIDAGNGVTLFVRERSEWVSFVRGYKRQGKRAGELMREGERERERKEREGWRGRCGLGEGMGGRDGGQGAYWVLVRGAVERIRRGEA